ncbi:hypothetical protein [Rubinisphaera sp.]|uniref:hypothetical protein n=1 Tax=Rubinisphaera sp. TaxID=2024857 RepID=UPI000C0EFBCD|nr:hypothetical protein [Rubinisphaera sp.]MBV11114.1 hypothetical protein [Rubinisphaera sp.]|tara:strand:- start:17632 stop:18516 length:885 start_codon:yes stop_codon:yes gene_type:complete
MSNSDSTTLPNLQTPDVASQKIRRQRRQKMQPNAPVQVIIAHEPPPQPAEPFEFSLKGISKAAKRWFLSAVAAGYGISLLFHCALLIAMSLYYFSDYVQENYIESSIASDEESMVFDDVMDVRIDMPAGDLATSESLETAMNMELSPNAANQVVTGVEDSVDSLFNEGGDSGNGGASFLVPKNAKIFTKGSFTAWTEPNDPGPNEDYSIVITVRLPDRVKRYRATDLSGQVVGTDGYKQNIPGPEYRRGSVYLPVVDRHAQLIIEVPGGGPRVQDTIEIRSTTLKEEQKLVIEF